MPHTKPGRTPKKEDSRMPGKFLGRYDLTCGQCGATFREAVTRYDGFKDVSTCPECSRTVRVYGIEC